MTASVPTVADARLDVGDLNRQVEEAMAHGPARGLYDVRVLLEEVASTYPRQAFAASLTFEPYYGHLVRLDYSRHPWAALLVAAAVPQVAEPFVHVSADRLLDDAWRMFVAQGEQGRSGQGIAHFVRGKRALHRGRLDEASALWRLARELLGAGSPVEEMNSAYLAFEAFQSGDLKTSRNVAAEALELARLRGNRHAEAFSRLLLAFFALYEGSFAQAEAELILSDAIYASLDSPAEATEHALVHTAFGALHAYRGRYAESEERFAKALHLADVTPGGERYRAISLAVRAELTAHIHPARAERDADDARRLLPRGVGGVWLAWVERALGVAASFRDDQEAALSWLAQATDACGNPLEQARCRLEQGRTIIRAVSTGKTGAGSTPYRLDDAMEPLKQAKGAFEAAGATYWLVQTYLALAAADPVEGPRWQGLARMTSLGDRAYETLFQAEGQELLAADWPFRLSLHGSCGVFISEFPPRFATRHAQLLVYVLALAGPDGADKATVTEQLWPGVPGDGAQKLRTALWQAKVALGPEAWRLRRDGDRLAIDLTGAYVDDAVAMQKVKKTIEQAELVIERSGSPELKAAEIRRRRLDHADGRTAAALLVLESPLLKPWGDLAWVANEQQRRLELAGRCREMLALIDAALAAVPAPILVPPSEPSKPKNPPEPPEAAY